MRLWLQRHARVLCEPGLCYGRTDVPADAEATQAAAQALARELPRGVALWSSPLRRCVALAEALVALRPDLGPVRLDGRLAEMHFGAWEGRLWSAIAREEFDAWTTDFADANVGGDGESTRQFMQRVAAAWEHWQAHGREAAWITHAGVIGAVQLLAQGVDCPRRADQWPRVATPPGECMRLGPSS